MFPFFKKKEPVKAPEPDVIHEDGGICIANRWWFEPEIGELSFNMTDSSKHRSSVISIVGSHGTGKNFTSKLILYRLCKEGAQATVLVSGLSRQKYGYMCDLLGGKTVFLGENAHINLFDIRKPNEDRCKGSVLERKIRELLAVFKTLMPGIIPKQTALLDMMLHEVYKKKGITLANAILWLHCHRDEFKDTEFIEVVNGNYPKYQVKIQQAMNDEGGALYLSCWYPLIKALSVDCMPEHITKDRVKQQAIYVNTYMLVYQAAKSLKDGGAVKELVGHLDTDADKITNLAFVLFCMELDMVNSIA